MQGLAQGQEHPMKTTTQTLPRPFVYMGGKSAVAGISARVQGIEDEIVRIANSLSDTHTDLVPFTEEPADSV
jgi:hypothetical protein